MSGAHVPSPHDLRLDTELEQTGPPPCVGNCKWLLMQCGWIIKSLSFVVPKVHDANECELVAIADAALVDLEGHE